MINAILKGLVGFVFTIISFFLDPIDELLIIYLPDLENALVNFSSLMNYLIGALDYVVDMTGLSSYSIGLIVAYLTFALTVPVLVWVIKVVVKWWHALVP